VAIELDFKATADGPAGDRVAAASQVVGSANVRHCETTGEVRHPAVHIDADAATERPQPIHIGARDAMRTLHISEREIGLDAPDDASALEIVAERRAAKEAIGLGIAGDKAGLPSVGVTPGITGLQTRIEAGPQIARRAVVGF